MSKFTSSKWFDAGVYIIGGFVLAGHVIKKSIKRIIKK